MTPSIKMSVFAVPIWIVAAFAAFLEGAAI
jgi:hypothetical protein